MDSLSPSLQLIQYLPLDKDVWLAVASMSRTVCFRHLPAVGFPFLLQFYPKFIGSRCLWGILTFFDECVCFVSSIDTAFYICGDFTIQVDMPGGNGKKFKSLIDLCNLKQLVA